MEYMGRVLRHSQLRHPDKVRSCEPAEAKAAFARLDAAAKVVEALFDPRNGFMDGLLGVAGMIMNDYMDHSLIPYV